MNRRRIEWHDARSELCIRFPYDERLLPVVRAFPGRRFDREERAWFCPVDAVVEVVETLHEHRFEVREDVAERYRRQGGKRELTVVSAPAGEPSGAPGAIAGRPFRASAVAAESDTWTVGRLNERAREVLRQGFPASLWVVGEITGFDRNQHRRTVHFELAEKEGEGDDATLRAAVGAVLFERDGQRIAKRLEESAEPFELRDGVEVRLRVRVDLYPARGSFQVIVEDVDPLHTLGKIAQNRARILAELDRRGLREKNVGLPWPSLPLRIGLLTSKESDAYNDFVDELRRSGYAFEITVADVRMQGPSLKSAVCGALSWFAQRAEQFDVLAIVRGGGSKTDLMWFDDLDVALAVATCPLKVVVGIGHHRDESVLDLLAHREKTPTAAAARLVAEVRAVEGRLHAASQLLLSRVRERLENSAQTLARHGEWLRRSVPVALRQERERARRALEFLPTRARRALIVHQQRLRACAGGLANQSRTSLRIAARELADRRARLSQPVLAARLESRAKLLHAHLQRVRALDASRILRRGFAIVRRADGTVVRDVETLNLDESVRVELARGSVEAAVRRLHPPPPESTDPQNSSEADRS